MTVRLALIGANGMLAQMVRKVAPEGYALHLLDLPEFDLTSRDDVFSALLSLNPQIIVNCAAYTNVDQTESEEVLANKVNGDGPACLAEVAHKIGATLVHISTDYVFDGTKGSPYEEEDGTNPLSAYGRTKLAGERGIVSGPLDKYFIIRTSWLYGPGGKNFVETVIRLACERQELRVVADQVGCPTYTEDLAKAIFALLDVAANNPNSYGFYHFSDEGLCSWHEFAEEIVRLAGEWGLPIVARQVLPISTEEYPLPATRPPYSVMSKKKYQNATGMIIPSWEESLRRYFNNRSKSH